jgi:hypothetical protein
MDINNCISRWKKMKLLKPVNLNLETMIKADQAYSYITYKDGKKGHALKNGSVYQKLIPYIYFFINQIIIKDKSRYSNSLDFSRIKLTDVQHIMTVHKMYQVVHFLTQQKIIEVKGISEFITVKGQQYSINAKYFRLLPGYCEGTEIIDIPIKIKPNININAMAKEQINCNAGIKHQYNLCRSYIFDFDNAEKYLQDLHDKKIITDNYFIRCHQHIQRLRNKDVIFTISEKTHRITTIINTCPKVLRRFFITDSVELDFQTFNVNVLVKLINDNINIMNISQPLIDEEEKISKETQLDFYNVIVEYFKNNSVIVEYFKENGMTIDRDTVKDIVLKNWIYARPDTKRFEFTIMKLMYPEITKLMTELKGKHHNEYLQYTYKYMQIESELVNNGIYKRFSEILPDVRLYTVYDCLIIDSKNKQTLLDIMKEESQKFFKRTINIKESKK